MIDIIIPAYNAHKTLGRALLSINKQINKENVVVYIIDDGSKKDYSEIIECYSKMLNIKLIRIDNSGPGKARQVGIESSSNEFIVFLDADDYFYNEYALINLFNLIQDADLAQGRFLEKKPNETIERDPQYCYLHGKMYRRSIIEKNNIEFEISNIKSGDIYEDSTYNQLYTLCCDKVASTNELVYVYEYNDTSLTKNNNNTVVNLKQFISAMNWLIDEIEKRNIKKEYDLAWYYCIAFYHSYFNYLLTPEECQFVVEDMQKLKKAYLDYFQQLTFEKMLETKYVRIKRERDCD